MYARYLRRLAGPPPGPAGGSAPHLMWRRLEPGPPPPRGAPRGAVLRYWLAAGLAWILPLLGSVALGYALAGSLAGVVRAYQPVRARVAAWLEAQLEAWTPAGLAETSASGGEAEGLTWR